MSRLSKTPKECCAATTAIRDSVGWWTSTPPTVLAQMVLSYFGNQLELIQPTADHRHIVIRRRVRRHDLVAR